MDYFPLFLNLKDQPCLVIGGGEVAARKIELLSRAGARITVIAEKISASITALTDKSQLNLIEKRFVDEDLDDFRLVVSATNDSETNQWVSRLAKERNIL